MRYVLKAPSSDCLVQNAPSNLHWHKIMPPLLEASTCISFSTVSISTVTISTLVRTKRNLDRQSFGENR